MALTITVAVSTIPFNACAEEKNVYAEDGYCTEEEYYQEEEEATSVVDALSETDEDEDSQYPGQLVTLYPVSEESSEYGLINEYYVDEDGNPVDFNLISENEELSQDKGELPAYFNLADEGRVTVAVEDQQFTGTCWAHASIGAAESNLITKNLISKDNINLSEAHLAWFGVSNSPKDENDPLYRDTTLLNDLGRTSLDRGGSLIYATTAWASGRGIVNENEYHDLTMYKQGTMVNKNDEEDEDATWYNQLADLSDLEYMRYYSDYILKGSQDYSVSIVDAVKSGDEEKKNQIITNAKQLLVDNGSMYCSYFASGDYLLKNTVNSKGEPAVSFYHTGEPGTNHAVQLVGWDDNFPKENFRTEAPADGAWILKNSWGKENTSTVDGYFYISYYDHSISKICSYDMALRSDYGDKIYQYDGTLGQTVSYTKAGSAMAAVFTATDDEPLKAVGFYTLEADMPYTIEIYTDVEDGKPNSGTLVHTEDGQLYHAGYSLIDLNKNVPIGKGKQFSVVIKLKKTLAWIQKDKRGYREGSTFYTSLNLETGNLGEWTDTYALSKVDICIKALTAGKGEKVLTVDSSLCRGTYLGERDIELYTQTKGADIYYTTDGSVPAIEEKNKYTGAIHLASGNTVIKAVAVKEGYINSRVSSFEYSIDKTITQNFIVNGEKIPVSFMVGEKYDSYIPADPDKKAEGLTFGGWFLDEACRYPISKKHVITDRDGLSIYAKLTGFTSYTVSFDADGGTFTGDDVIKLNKDDKIPSLPVPEKTGYSFIGWYCGGYKVEEGSVITSVRNYVTDKLVFKAEWKKLNSYILTFDPDGGIINGDETLTVYEGGSIKAVPEATKEGYEFLGWYFNGKQVKAGATIKELGINKDVKIVAKWQKLYVITFDADGGVISGVSKITLKADEKIAGIPKALKAGKEFAGWTIGDVALKEGMTVASLKIDGNATAKAVWNNITIEPGQKVNLADFYGPFVEANPGKYRLKVQDKKISGTIKKGKYIVTAKKTGVSSVYLQKKEGKKWVDVEGSSCEITVLAGKFLYWGHRNSKDEWITTKLSMYQLSEDYNTVEWSLKNKKGKNIASIDPKTGELTVTASGDVKVTAKITRDGYTKKISSWVNLKFDDEK